MLTAVPATAPAVPDGPAGAPAATSRARPGDAVAGSFLARCDPAVLLAVVVAVPLLLVRVYDLVTLLVLWTATLVAALTAGRLPVRRLLLTQVPFLGFGASLVMVNAVTRGGSVVAEVVGMSVTDAGLRMGAALAVRTLLIGLCAAALLAVTDPGRLLTSLHAVARLPIRAACALLAAHRLLDDLPHEWLTIRQAQAIRGPGPADRRAGPDRLRRLSRSPDALARAGFVLLVCALRRAERIALSLESRGLGALGRGERTVWRPASTGRPDVVLVLVVGLTTAAGIAFAAR